MRKFLAFVILATLTIVSCNPNSSNNGGKDLESCENHDVEYVLNGISGMYYGNQYSESEDVHNYCVILAPKSNICNMLTGAAEFEPNSQYLFLDLYSNTPAPDGLQFRIPNGTYHLDANGTTAANTIGSLHTFLITTSDDDIEEFYFSHGTVTVTDSAINVIFIDGDNKVYHIRSKNSAIDNTDTYDNCKAEGIFSTMVESVQIPFAEGSAKIKADNWGDFLWNGSNLWDIIISNTASNDEIKLRIMVDSGKTFPEGTYPVSGDFDKENILFGFADINDVMAGSWYFKYVAGSNDLVAYAPVTEGSVTFSPIADGKVTITIDVKEELGYSISGACTVEVPTPDKSLLQSVPTTISPILHKTRIVKH